MEAAKQAVNHLMGYGSKENEEAQHQAPVENSASNEHETTGGASNKDTVMVPDDHASNQPGETSHHEHGAAESSSDSTKSAKSSDSDLTKVQSPDQGPDPALVGDPDANPKNTKMTGTGTDGSHSAVFGLTPDGHTHDDTTHGATPVKPAHSDETTVSSKKKSADAANDNARAGGGVNEQLDQAEAQPGKKGLERTDPTPAGAGTDSGKPGAGGIGLQQGSGEIPAK